MEINLLRLVHVVGGVFWVGTAVFTAGFLLPALREAGPAAGAVMAGLQRRRLMVFLPLVALLTLLSGIRLLWIVSGGFAPSYLATRRGLTFTVSGAVALLAFVLGFAISRPTMSRVATLTQRAAASEGAERDTLLAEIQALRRRAERVGTVVAVLLALATAGMALARYA